MKLTKRLVDKSLPRSKQYTVWCGELKGFGVYIMPSGTKTYFVDYRNAENIRRRITIGRHGKITTEEARRLAIVTFGSAVKGDDPASRRDELRKSITVKQLCEQYLQMAEKGLILGKSNRPKKPSTISTDKGRVLRHIIPLLGNKKITSLNKSDINRFVRDVASGKTAMIKDTENLRGKAIVTGGNGTATRTTGLFSGIMSYAVSEGFIEHNPVWGIKRPAYNMRTKRLSVDEYVRLGKALRDAQMHGETRQVIDAIMLIAITGCRRGEITKLRWSEFENNNQCLRLEDSKEGASVRPIGKVVCNYLNEIKIKQDCEMVLPPIRSGLYFGGLSKGWKRIAKLADIENVTPHTLRHSFASVAADLNYSESTIAAMLGHSMHSVTNRYIHQLDSVLIAAADDVSDHIVNYMNIDL